MAPFIKFRESKAGTTGDAERLVFLNATAIVKAVYESETGRLTLTLTTVQPGDRGGHYQTVQLEGEDARQALAVLQRL